MSIQIAFSTYLLIWIFSCKSNFFSDNLGHHINKIDTIFGVEVTNTNFSIVRFEFSSSLCTFSIPPDYYQTTSVDPENTNFSIFLCFRFNMFIWKNIMLFGRGVSTKISGLSCTTTRVFLSEYKNYFSTLYQNLGRALSTFYLRQSRILETKRRCTFSSNVLLLTWEKKSLELLSRPLIDPLFCVHFQ